MTENLDYKVLEEVEIDGKTYPIGDIVSLDADTAASLIQDGKIEAADEGGEEEE